jgi:hypothetical protein
MKKSVFTKFFFALFVLGLSLTVSNEASAGYWNSKESESITALMKENREEDALIIALSIEDHHKQSQALYQISVTHIPKGDFEGSLSIINQMKDPFMQDAALAGIVLNYIELGSLEKAKETALQMNSSLTKEHYLTKISAAKNQKPFNR